MTDEVLDEVIDSTEDMSLASTMGWTPRDQYKGPPEKWKSAKDYIEYGETVLPILRSQNKALHQQLQTNASELAELKRMVAAGQATTKQLEEFYTKELERQTNQARASLAAELKQAREEGDTAREVELLGDIADLKSLEKPPARKEEQQELPPMAPAFLNWAAKNPWVDKDIRKSRRAVTIGAEIREDLPELGGNDAHKNPAFYDELDRRLAKELGGPADRPGDGKVASSGGAGNAGGGGAGKGYADLPADAKKVCDEDVRNFVGANKPFKTKPEWQKHYAEIYWRAES